MSSSKEYMKNYNKQYYEKYGDKKRKQARDWYRNNKKRKQSYDKKYRESKKYKECQKKYHQSEHGKFTTSQSGSQLRNLGFVLITDEIPNEPYDFHHLNHNLVAPIPSDLHGLLKANNLEQHRFFCYQIIKQLYKRNN